MEEKRTKRDLRSDLLLIAALIAWAFFVNRQFRISGLYKDDLYTWSCWGEQSFLQYAFPLDSTRCRFVYWTLSWLELGLIGGHLEWIVPINILLNAGLASFLYYFAKRLSGSRPVAFLVGVLFLGSHFAYYQIGQLLGLMETLGVFFALLQAYFLYRYLSGKSERRDFLLALLVYFLNCFTHERYMVLLPMFFYCLLVRRDKKWQRYLLAAGVFLLVQGIRLLMIGTVSPEGTGGTSLKDTFTLQSAISNFGIEGLYTLGINAGPEHLCGRPWEDTSFRVKVMVLFWNLAMLSYLLISFYQLFLSRRYRKRGAEGMKLIRDLIFFAGFWIGCAAASAVTIRVELRWVYVLYAFQLLTVAYLYGIRQASCHARNQDPEAKHRYRFDNAAPLTLLGLVAFLSLVMQQYYRQFIPKIYLFPDQARYNSLADVTYGTYGREVLGKEIIIVGKSYEMNGFTERTFFKTFDPARNGQGTTVRRVDSIYSIGLIHPHMLVLTEDPAHDAFRDVTKAVRDMKCAVEYGYYRDEWMDQRASLRIMTQDGDKIRFHVTYPGTLRGDEVITVRTEAGEQSFPLSDNEAEFVIEATPWSLNRLSFSTNFIVANAAEKRGTTPLAMLVHFETETED